MKDTIVTTPESILDSTPRRIIADIAAEYTTSHPRVREQLERTTQFLGEKLNRTDTHFVAELVQNAEDAGNDLENRCVELHFLLEAKQIVVQNNGRPFDEENVRAICSTALSSKIRDPDSIGYLGVGFKSVFKITEAPEIHSKGFHFRITRYIYPSWIDDSLPLPTPGMHSAFVLPLKPGVDLQALSQELDQLEPTLLLFLKKLKSIAIDNRVTGQTSIVDLRESSNGITTLDSFQGMQRWRIATLAYWQPDAEQRPSSREHHDMVEIRAAFRITDDGRFTRTTPGLFFAFLPTEQETGLGFHLQADFIPTLSRESLENNTWNQEILAHAAQGLVQQLCIFRDEGTHDLDLYNLFPLEEETHDIAGIVAREVCMHATTERLILTRNATWHMPHDTLRPAFADLRDLISLDDLSYHYGRTVDFIHPEISERSLKVIERLGVKTFDMVDLIRFLAESPWIESCSNDWLAKLLVFLYEKREHIQSSLVQELQQIPLLPLQNGSRAAASPVGSSRPVYLPLKEELSSSYMLFSQHLDLIASHLLEAATATGRSDQVIRSLQWLGVRPFEAQRVIEDIILPLFERQDTVLRSDPLYDDYLDFVRRHWEHYRRQAAKHGEESEKAAVQRAAAALQFRVQGDTPLFSPATSLILGTAYAPKEQLEHYVQNLPGVQFLSSTYADAEGIARKSKTFTGSSWKDFLHDLGALDRLDVVRIIDTIIIPQFQSEEWKNNNWFPLTDFIRRFIDDYERERGKSTSKDNNLHTVFGPYLWTGSTRRDPIWYFYRLNQLFLPHVEGDPLNIASILGSLLNHYFVDCDAYVQRSSQTRYQANENVSLRDSWLKLFQRIGAQQYTPVSLIEQVIIPAYKQGRYRLLSDEQQLEALDFVRRHYPTYVNAMRQQGHDEQETARRLGLALRFAGRSTDGEYRTAPELFLTKKYKPEDDLEQRLAGLPGVEFIHDCYVERERGNRAFSGPSWREFLTKIGVNNRFDVVQIIDHSILPQFAGDTIPDGWFALTDFVRQYITEYEKRCQEIAQRDGWNSTHILDDLRKGVWLASTQVTDGVTQFQLPQSLYRSRPYWEHADIAVAFGDLLAKSYVSDTYWEQSSEGKNESEQKELRQSWQELFNKLGIRDYLSLDGRTVSDVYQYPGCFVTWNLERSTASSEIYDYWDSRIEVFLKNLSGTGRQKHATARAFLNMLDQHWHDAYEQYVTATYSWFYRSRQRKRIPSAFGAILQSAKWIPTLSGHLVAHGHTLFDRRRLGDVVTDPDHLCAVNVKNAYLRTFLGIRDTLTVDDILELLEKARKMEKPDRKQVRSLYEWLQKNWSTYGQEQRSRVITAFRDKPMIYLPDETPVWYTAYECTWQRSPLALVAEKIPSLASHYDGLRTFFVEFISIEETPDILDILNVLWDLAESGPLPPTQFGDVYRCYEDIERQIHDWEDYLDAYRDAPIWLCPDGQIRSASDVYVNDNVTLFELFSTSIHCLWLPEGTPDGVLANLWSVFDLKRLSEATPHVTESHLETTGARAPDWSRRVQQLTNLITRYLFTFQQTTFLSRQADKRIEQLYCLEVISVVGKIPVDYRLPRGELVRTEQSIFVDLGQGRMYVAPDLRIDDFSLAQEFARIISADRELQNFIESMIIRLDSPVLDQVIKQKNLAVLPDDIIQSIQPVNTLPDVADVEQANVVEDVPLPHELPASQEGSNNGSVTSTTDSVDHTVLDTDAIAHIGDETDLARDNTDQPDDNDEPAPGDTFPGNEQPVSSEVSEEQGAYQTTNTQPDEHDASSHSSITGTDIRAVPPATEARPSKPNTDDRANKPKDTVEQPDESSPDQHDYTTISTPSGAEQHQEQPEPPNRPLIDTNSTQGSTNGVQQPTPASKTSPSSTPSSSDNQSRRDTKPSPQTERHDRPRSRLRSYVEHTSKEGTDAREDHGESQAVREQIAQAGITAAIAYEKSNGRHTVCLPHNHEGWDIDSYADPNRNHLVRRIEVKATRSVWDGWGVYLTTAEFHKAQLYKDNYFLYVVEYALDPASCKIYVFQNPAGRINEYRFDDKWKMAASDTRRVADITQPLDSRITE